MALLSQLALSQKKIKKDTIWFKATLVLGFFTVFSPVTYAVMRFLASASLLGFAIVALRALSCSGDKAVYVKFMASVEATRVAPGSAPQRLYKPSAESAAPESVLPPAPNSLFFRGMIFVIGCMWACAANMLVN